jgi:hypothetical protein
VPELKAAQNMLENARGTSEAARAENRHLEIEFAQSAISAKRETDALLRASALHRKRLLQAEQQQLRGRTLEWWRVKSELQTQAERRGLVGHEILHQSVQARNSVEEQRWTVVELATQPWNDLDESKKLKDPVEDAKAKIALAENLAAGREANREQGSQLRKSIQEQKQRPRAIRISTQGRLILDEIAEQTEGLTKAKDDAELQAAAVTREEDAQIAYRRKQMALLAPESELRELQAEFERVKRQAVAEGRRNVELQKAIREEKKDATVRYVATHARDIYRVGHVQSTLMTIRQQKRDRAMVRLPPLRPERRSGSALVWMIFKA